MTQLEGEQLLAAFGEILLAQYLDGRYPSPPVDPIGESLPDPLVHSHGGSDSSVEDNWEDNWEDMWDDEDHVLGALPMGEEELAGVGEGRILCLSSFVPCVIQ